MAFLQRKKKTKWGAVILSLLLPSLLLLFFSVMLNQISSANDVQATAILERSVSRSITECYALEGAYPPDIDYLTKHYGLTYDTDRYFIDYQYIGANLRPDVTILKKGDSSW